MRRSKLYKQQLEVVGDTLARHTIDEAIAILKKLPGVKFDQTAEVSIKLGIDPRKSDQTVRGAVALPRGTGKTVRVAVVAEGAAAEEAKAAGADIVGFDDLVQTIKEGKLDFDILISTPDAMRMVRPLGRQLGPRGLMPNPKTGTVTENVEPAVKEAKAGRVEFRADKGACVQVPVGKLSFAAEDLAENCGAVIQALVKAKPASAKGVYIQTCTLSSTMSPGIKVDVRDYMKEQK